MVEIAKRNAVGKQYVSRLIRLAFLAPEMVERIVAGRQPPELTAQAPRTGHFDIPVDWAAQKRVFKVKRQTHLQAKSTAQSANREKSPKLAFEPRRDQFSGGPGAPDSGQMRVFRAGDERIPKTERLAGGAK
jgi:hypothetical protein